MFKKITPNKNWLIFDNNPLMKINCENITLPLNEKDIDIISKMMSYIDACYENKHKEYDINPGIGIAAIQFGYAKKIIYIHFKENEIENKYLLANPKIISYSSQKSYLEKGEGCLSVKKEFQGLSIRKNKIIVKALDLFSSKEIQINASNLLSICLQHEIDHTNNLFFYDRINKENPLFVEPDWIKI